jgi:imidazolonepropionase-like amidohydrolase
LRISGLLAVASVAATCLVGVVQAQTIAGPAEVVIRATSIVDVETGRLAPARDIVVRGTRIERIVAAGGALPAAKTLVDGRGKFVVPGLIEAPVRLAAFSPTSFQRLLSAGVTSVLDVGTDPAQIGRWRRDLDSGRLYAPRLADGCRGTAATEPPTATSPTRPDAVHDRLVQAVAAGRTPAQALRAVTIDRARALCRDGFGTVAAGQPADFVVLSANPLDDIRHTRAIDAVVFRGEVLTRAHLNMLAQGTLPMPTPAR